MVLLQNRLGLQPKGEGKRKKNYVAAVYLSRCRHAKAGVRERGRQRGRGRDGVTKGQGESAICAGSKQYVEGT
jgi:hypothetical protein